MPRRDTVGCSFCGEMGHTYTSCALLQQMVQEQAEQLQQCRTEEYRAVQSRSVRQSIIEEYGEDDSMPRREDVYSDRRVPSAREGGDPVPPSRMGHGGPLPYPAMMPATRKTYKWEEEMPRDGTQVTEKGYSAARGTRTGGVYFPRYQRPASTSTPYESYGRGYTGEAGVPAGGPPGGGRQPPRGGPRGGSGGYDPDDGGDDEEEDDDSDASDRDPRERVRWPSVPRWRHLVSAPGGAPLDDPDPDGSNTHAWMRGMCRQRGQRGEIGHPGAPRMPKYAGTPRHGLLTSTGFGEPPSLNFTTNTLGMENSLRYMGDSMNRLLEAQRGVNQTVAAHMNATVAAQETQSEALVQLVENTRQREFNAIPIYDGQNPERFEPWLEQLQNACRTGKRDIREVAMCCAGGPVLEVLQSMDPKLGWSKHRDELRRCFSPDKTSVHAAALLIQFRKQEKNENLRSYIHQYTKLHLQATNLLPKNDFDLLRKVQFLHRLHSKTIANKIVQSNAFKNCATYSMADCFAKALELEGEFQVGEVVSTDADTQILMALAAGEQEEVNEITGTGEADRRTPAYNPNPCFHCKEIGHFRRDCPLLNSPVPVIAGKLHHTLDVETPVGKEMLDDFLSKLLCLERRGAKLLAKLHKERQQNAPRQYPPAQ